MAAIVKIEGIEQAPALKIDAILYRNSSMHVRTKIERRVVWNFMRHMAANGWQIHSVYGGDEVTRARTPSEAMELIFNLDESCPYFVKGKAKHNVYFVNGNGRDILSDWNYSIGDADGFDAVVNAFDSDIYV